jgi:large subunit ribosomal protein L5
MTLKEKFQNEVVPELKTRMNYQNIHQVPMITKVVLNMGVGTRHDKADLEQAALEMGQITGQRPVITKARKSIANFKLREGNAIGCKVTLRGNLMWGFLDRLINIALPRVRDFRGIPSTSFDGRGSYSLGIVDQTIFPEIDLDKVKRTQGMNITIVTTAETDAEALELLTLLGMPFKKAAESQASGDTAAA